MHEMKKRKTAAKVIAGIGWTLWLRAAFDQPITGQRTFGVCLSFGETCQVALATIQTTLNKLTSFSLGNIRCKGHGVPVGQTIQMLSARMKQV